MATKHKREKAARRRAGVLVGVPAAPVAPHSPRCQCRSCERREERRTARLKDRTEKRVRHYAAGHSCPEHRQEWLISGHRLIEYFATHQADRDRRAKLTRVEMREEWVSHLDGLFGERQLDAGRLYEALLLLEVQHPLRASIVKACALEGLTQGAVGERLCLTRQAVGQNLAAARDMLMDNYGGLILVEEHAASRPS